MMAMQILNAKMAKIDTLGKALGSKMKPNDESLNESPSKMDASVFGRL